MKIFKKIAFGDDFLRFSVVRKVFYTFLYHKKRLPAIFIFISFLTTNLTLCAYAGPSRESVEEANTAEDHYRMWVKYFDEGNYDSSIPFMKRAIQLDGSYSAKIREHIERSIDEELIYAAIAEGADTAEDHYRMWVKYFDEGNYDSSIPFMKRAIQLDGSYSAKIREHIERSIDEELIYSAIAEGADTAEDHYRMWVKYFDEGNYDSSIPFMKRAIQLDGSYSAKIKTHIAASEEETLREIDVESKQRDVLAREKARELIEKRGGEEAPQAFKRR